jgi:hypothetical protein
VGRFWRRFFAGFVLGITHEVGVPLFLVILPLKSRGKSFVFFWFSGSGCSCGRGTRFVISPFLECFGA